MIVGYIPQIVHLIKERCTPGISILAFSLWCSASLLFLIHATMIEDAVFVGVQVVNLVAGGLIVWFCKRYRGHVCPFHRELYSRLEKGLPALTVTGDPAKIRSAELALAQKSRVAYAQGQTGGDLHAGD